MNTAVLTITATAMDTATATTQAISVKGNEDSRSYDYSRNYDSSRINRYGSAIGALNSLMQAQAMTSSPSRPLVATRRQQSEEWISMGAGHDGVELTSLAEGSMATATQ